MLTKSRNAAFLHYGADSKLLQSLTLKFEVFPYVSPSVNANILRTLKLDLQVSIPSLINLLLPRSDQKTALEDLVLGYGAEEEAVILNIAYGFGHKNKPEPLKKRGVMPLDTALITHQPCLRCIYINSHGNWYQRERHSPFCKKTKMFIEEIAEQLRILVPDSVRQHVAEEEAERRLADGTWVDILTPEIETDEGADVRADQKIVTETAPEAVVTPIQE